MHPAPYAGGAHDAGSRPTPATTLIQTSSPAPPLGTTTSVPRSAGSSQALLDVVAGLSSTSPALATVTAVPRRLAHGTSVDSRTRSSVGERHDPIDAPATAAAPAQTTAATAQRAPPTPS